MTIAISLAGARPFGATASVGLAAFGVLDQRARAVTSVLLVRHAEPIHASVWADECTRPLSEQGRVQARALGEQLRERRIDAIYSSPYLRAIETVEPLASASGARAAAGRAARTPARPRHHSALARRAGGVLARLPADCAFLLAMPLPALYGLSLDAQGGRVLAAWRRRGSSLELTS